MTIEQIGIYWQYEGWGWEWVDTDGNSDSGAVEDEHIDLDADAPHAEMLAALAELASAEGLDIDLADITVEWHDGGSAVWRRERTCRN